MMSCGLLEIAQTAHRSGIASRSLLPAILEIGVRIRLRETGRGSRKKAIREDAAIPSRRAFCNRAAVAENMPCVPNTNRDPSPKLPHARPLAVTVYSSGRALSPANASTPGEFQQFGSLATAFAPRSGLSKPCGIRDRRLTVLRQHFLFLFRPQAYDSTVPGPSPSR